MKLDNIKFEGNLKDIKKLEEILGELPEGVVKYTNPKLNLSPQSMEAELLAGFQASIYPTSELDSIILPEGTSKTEAHIPNGCVSFKYNNKDFAIYFRKKEK